MANDRLSTTGLAKLIEKINNRFSPRGHKHSVSDLTDLQLDKLSYYVHNTYESIQEAFQTALTASIDGYSTADDDYFISTCQESGSNNEFFVKTFEDLWTYIYDKIVSYFGLTSTKYSGKAASAGISQGLYYAKTSGGTSTFTATIDGITEYYTGLMVVINFNVTPVKGATLNINSLGAKTIKYRDQLSGTYFTVAANYLFVYDGTNFTAIHSYTSNTVDNAVAYTKWTVDSVGLTKYNLCMEQPGGKIGCLTTNTSPTINTTKTRSTNGFLIGADVYYATTGPYSAGTIIPNTSYFYESTYSALVDLRYSTNAGSTLTAGKPVYLVGTVSNGLFYLDTTWWTQTTPTTEDDKVYIYIGQAYDTYRCSLASKNHWLEFKDGSVRPYANHLAASVTNETLTLNIS